MQALELLLSFLKREKRSLWEAIRTASQPRCIGDTARNRTMLLIRYDDLHIHSGFAYALMEFLVLAVSRVESEAAHTALNTMQSLQ